MNIFIYTFMAVWAWALVTSFITHVKVENYNNSYLSNIRGKAVLNKYGRMKMEFVKFGLFMIVAYWMYVWFIQ